MDIRFSIKKEMTARLNANLPPDICVQHENLMISALILGSKELKDFNSFLQPLVNELKQLQGI